MAGSNRQVGDRVSVNHEKYPGIWTITSIGPVNTVLEPVGGGRSLRAPHHLVIDPVEGAAAVTAPTFYVLGEIVRMPAGGKFDGLYVVIADKGGDKVNLAKLGGDSDRYVRAARRGLVKVNLADVLIAS